MRLGISTALKHTTPKEWAEKMELLGCKAVVFPVDCTASDLLVADYMNEAKKHDLLIAEVGIWKNVFAVNPKEREEAREYARRQLRLADEILADRFGMEDILKTFLRKHGVNWSVIQKN